jgi:hypothetical protein
VRGFGAPSTQAARAETPTVPQHSQRAGSKAKIIMFTAHAELNACADEEPDIDAFLAQD